MPATARDLTGDLVAPEIGGRAVAVLIFALFAVAWASWGSSVPMPASIRLGIAVVVILAAALLVAGAVAMFRRAAGARSGTLSRDQVRRMNRGYTAVVIAECVVIGGGSSALGATGNAEWIPALITGTVGMHFVPLAAVFSMPAYRLAGGLMVVAAAVTGVLGSLVRTDAVTTALPCLSAAATLLVTGLGICERTLRSTGAKNRQPSGA